MSDITLYRFDRIAAGLLLAVITASHMTACNPGRDSAVTSDTAPIPMTAEQTEIANDPVFESYPYSFYLDDGTEISISLPRDPELHAEMHLCTLSESDTPAHVLIHNIAGGTGVSVDEVRVFSGDSGSEYPVISVNETLERYVEITSDEEHWCMTVGGAEYLISKDQFSEYPSDELLPKPDASLQQNFFVENGQLFCRVMFLCAGAGTGFAEETLKIRYDIVDGTVTASEITFEKPETAGSEIP